MALQKTITLDNGIEVNDAYLKIISVKGDKSNISFNIAAFTDSGNVNVDPLKLYYGALQVNVEGNIWEQVYSYFKTTDDGADSIDV